jgi:hypothetical protein
MDLNGAYILHKAFGRGQIIEHEKQCVTILFQETNEKKRFIYPDAFGTFLVLESKKLVKQVQDLQDEIAQTRADAQLEAQREHESSRALEKKEKAKKPAKKTTRAKKPVAEKSEEA